MTKTRAPYLPQQTLDACLRPEHVPERPAYDVADAGLPERRRAAVARVIEMAFPRVVEHLALPVETWEAEGRRGVWLWGVLEISAAADGTDLRLDYLSDDPDAEGCAATANLSLPINRFGLAAAMSPILVAPARECGLHPKALPGPAGTYIRRVLARTFTRSVHWNRLRRSVLGHLRLDPLAVSLTRRTFEGGHAQLESFNWVARHMRELALVAAEHPRLLPFLQLVSHVDGPPVASLEGALREAGITPSARRKLEGWGFEPFAQALEHCILEGAIEMVAGLANLLDRLEIHDPPDPTFVELALRGGLDTPPVWFLRTLYKEVDAISDADDPCPRDYEFVAAWINSKPPTPDPRQQQSWRWMIQQSLWHRARADDAALGPWPVPSGTLTIDGHEVVPLRCAVDLVAETEAMDNCLATYRPECRAGKMVVYSIRKGERRVADIALSRGADGSGWELMEVAGRRNRRAPEMEGLARALIQQLRTTT